MMDAATAVELPETENVAAERIVPGATISATTRPAALAKVFKKIARKLDDRYYRGEALELCIQTAHALHGVAQGDDSRRQQVRANVADLMKVVASSGPLTQRRIVMKGLRRAFRVAEKQPLLEGVKSFVARLVGAGVKSPAVGG